VQPDGRLTQSMEGEYFGGAHGKIFYKLISFFPLSVSVSEIKSIFATLLQIYDETD
jgi:hypothetical protein